MPPSDVGKLRWCLRAFKSREEPREGVALAIAEAQRKRLHELCEDGTLARVLEEHSTMLDFLNSLRNRCQDYEGHRMNRDDVAFDIRFFLTDLENSS